MLDGPLYAVGGNDGWSFLNTVERWDPQFRSWNFVAPMNTPRSTHGVVAFDSKIFAVGGRDVSSCLRSVECFDPHFNRWTQMANLNKRRGMPGVAVFQDCIFAVGGHDTPGKAQKILILFLLVFDLSSQFFVEALKRRCKTVRDR